VKLSPENIVKIALVAILAVAVARMASGKLGIALPV
jgi:hypothetical protein